MEKNSLIRFLARFPISSKRGLLYRYFLCEFLSKLCKRSFLLFLTPSFLCISCASNYHSRGILGTGFNDFRLGSDRFTVTYRGNQYTTAEDVKKFALRRASELAVQNGFFYFVIASEKDISKKTEVHSSSKNAEIVYPALEITIQCFKEKPTVLFVDAKEFLLYNLK